MNTQGALTHADYRAAYWLLGECSELGALPEVWCAHLHEALEQRLGVYMSVFVEGSHAMAHGETPPSHQDRVLIYGAPGPAVLKAMHDYGSRVKLRDDPALPAWRRVRTPVATRSRMQLASTKRWCGSKIVNEYFRSIGCDEMMLSRCPAADGRWLMLNLWRAIGERPFGEREVSFVNLLFQECTALLIQGRLAPLRAGFSGLTPRQRQVLTLLCRGLSEKQVAHVLGASVHTVHNHIQSLHRALGVHSRGELLSLAYRRRLTDGHTSLSAQTTE